MTTSLKSYAKSSGQSEPDLTQWQGLYVRVQALQMGSIVLAEGEVSKANPFMMILARGKGRNSLMIEAREIEHLNEIPRPVIVPKLIIRNLSSVDENTVRQHLADRHGWLIGKIHDDPKIALQFHDLAHAEGKLGHKHDDPAEPALTPDEVNRRAVRLNQEHALMLECLSCGYYRGVGDDGRSFQQIAGKLDDDGQPAYHCSECQDEEEFKYV